MRTGDAARAAGVNLQTLGYYEGPRPAARTQRQLCWAPCVSTQGGHHAARHQGGPAARIHPGRGRRTPEVGHHHGKPRLALQARARDKLEVVDARISDLQTIRATLIDAMDAGCDDLVSCRGVALLSDPVRADRLRAVGELCHEGPTSVRRRSCRVRGMLRPSAHRTARSGRLRGDRGNPAFVGVAFALAVAAVSFLALVVPRRSASTQSCVPSGPADLILAPTRSTTDEHGTIAT